jgi:putative ATP-dependent endonuclease of the OLD family
MIESLPPPKLLGFGIANYRSFDNDGFLIEDIRKINVFIGKNNCGKSNVLRTLALLREINDVGHSHALKSFDSNVDTHRRSGQRPSITIIIPAASLFSHPGFSSTGLPEYYESKAGNNIKLRWNHGTGVIEGSHPFDVFSCSQLGLIHKILFPSQSFNTSPVDKDLYYNNLSPALIKLAANALQGLQQYLAIPVFREIRKTTDPRITEDEVFNGHNIIAKLREMQHPKVGRDDDQVLFYKIQDYIRELVGDSTLTWEIPNSDDRIYIRVKDTKLPLDSYGTGLHHLVLMCSALAMYENHYVTIEEPEIHLHPELQRHFLRFIAKTNNTSFITTHSNVFLDFQQDANIFHVRHNGVRSTVDHVNTSPAARAILTDTGYKASDLLQSNGIVWVEGPSDRIYLNKWLSLLAPELIEGIHYAIVFYGGKVLSHFCCNDETAEDLVEMLRINTNALVIMDRDGDLPTVNLNATKERIRCEVGEGSCWVTEGREVENYLSATLLGRFLEDKYSKPLTVKFSPDERLEEVLAAVTAAEKHPINYAKAKPDYARKFCELMTQDDLDVLDLKEQLTNLVSKIRGWNHMETPAVT